MRFVVGCDYLRESWVQFYGTMGVERDWSEKGEEGRQSVAGCRTGVEGSLSLDMDILLSLPFPRKPNCNIMIAMHCCIAAIPCPCPCPCPMSKHSTAYLHPAPVYLFPQRIGTPGFKRGPGLSEPEGYILCTSGKRS